MRVPPAVVSGEKGAFGGTGAPEAFAFDGDVDEDAEAIGDEGRQIFCFTLFERGIRAAWVLISMRYWTGGRERVRTSL